MFEELDAVRAKCATCQKCDLAKTRTKSVFSDGIANSKLMLIGEAPGANEDMQGVPFVGRAGKLLDQIFESVGLSRQNNLYICNTIKCRPPENRDPLPCEKEACRPYLNAQIDTLKPRLILLCGKVALKSFMDTNLGITKIRGKWYDGPHGAKMMPIFHPSYLFRNHQKTEGSPRWLMWQDIQEIKRAYDTLD